jgi:hypothetical protein
MPNYPPIPVSDRLLTSQEIIVLALLYFPYLEVIHVDQIALRESGRRTAAWNNNPGVEDSRGLMQININAWPICRGWNLWDPQVNLYWAGYIWKLEGWRPWYAGRPPYLPWLDGMAQE